MAESAPFLPYRCDALRADFLQSPCAKKLAALKAIATKYPGALLGPLEHCLTCRGLKLIVRPHPAGGAEVKAPEPAPPARQISPSKEDESMRTAVVFKDEAEAERYLGPGKVPGAAAAGGNPAPGRFCKNHPKVEAHRAKSGRFMGLCLACMREREARNSRNRGGRMAVVSETLPVLAQTAAAEVSAALTAETTPTPGVSRGTAPPLHPEMACKNHPDRPARVDRLGRTMRFCQECLQERGRKTGVSNFASSTPPITIPLNAPEYAELREWLIAQAAEFERTLAKEIMYRLKIAMREARVLG